MGFSGFRRVSFARVVIAAGLVLSLAFSAQAQSAGSGPLEQAVAELKKQRLYEVLFRLHPKAEAEFRRKYMYLDADKQRSLLAKDAGAYERRLAGNYVNQHLEYASEAMIYRYLTNQRDVYRELSRKPELCARHKGRDRTMNPADLLGLPELDNTGLFADLLEDVGANPPEPARPLDMAAAFEMLKRTARAKGIDIEDRFKPGNDQKDRCKSEMLFFEALLSLGEKDAANFMRAQLRPSKPSDTAGSTKARSYETRKPLARRMPASEIPGFVDGVMLQIKKMPAYDALFRLDGEAEGKLRAILTHAYETYPRAQVDTRLREKIEPFVSDYFDTYVAYASNAVVYRYLEETLAVLIELEDRPRLCVKYFLGETVLLKRVTDLLDPDLNTDVFTSALNTPSPPPDPLDEAKATRMLVASYWENDLDPEMIDIVDTIETHDPAVGCPAATTDMRALLAMGERDAVYVFKTFRAAE